MKYQTERNKTLWVIIITFVAMVAEIGVGMWSGSMALLADGWHMASHVGALTLAWVTYRLADGPNFKTRFAFGGGKILGLGGYTSALLLIIMAIWMVVESIQRLMNPIEIHTQEAIVVAVAGLLVNLVCAFILRDDHSHHDHHDHHHEHEHHDHGHSHGHDHNMAGAYAHVLADAMTSVLAIVALFLAATKGWWWADALTGIVGAVMILRWGYGLILKSGYELLDGHERSIPTDKIQATLINQGYEVSCLHVWRLDAKHTAVHIRASSKNFKPGDHKFLRQELLGNFAIDHLVLEVSNEAPDHCPLD